MVYEKRRFYHYFMIKVKHKKQDNKENKTYSHRMVKTDKINICTPYLVIAQRPRHVRHDPQIRHSVLRIFHRRGEAQLFGLVLPRIVQEAVVVKPH